MRRYIGGGGHVGRGEVEESWERLDGKIGACSVILGAASSTTFVVKCWY